MNDFSPCCMKRINELDAEGAELSKFQDKGVEVHVSGCCRTCGMALIFNHIHHDWGGELDLGTVPTPEYIDEDSVVRPD